MTLLDIKVALSRVLALCLKDAKLYYFKGPTIVMGILLPVFLWFAYAVGAGNSLVTSLPMLITISAFFASSSITPIIMPWETRQKTLEMLLSRPVTIYTILLGTALASTLYGILISLGLVFIGLLLNLIPQNPLLLIFGICVSSLCYSFIGLLFAAIPTDIPADVVFLSSAVRLPLIFISGVFIPLQKLPRYVLPLAFSSPLTYLSDLMKSVYYGTSYLNPSLDLAVLALLTVVFALLALMMNKVTLMKRL